MEDDDLTMDGDVGHQGSSDGNQTPVIDVNVSSQFAAGATPIVPMPGSGSNALFAQAILNQQMQHHQAPWPYQHNHHPHQHFSSSAPASIAPVAAGAWLTLNPYPAPQPRSRQAVGGAQHVTGMMGAAMLEDLDEADEVFGEGSEIMDRD